MARTKIELRFRSYSNFPLQGNQVTLYIATDTNLIYRWDGLAYVEVGGGGGGSVESVTGLNTDNTDPTNPVVQISVDGVTVTGDGTPGNPLVAVGDGTGDVHGPASAVDDRIATFDGTTGKIIQDGGVKVSDLATAAQGALADTAVQPARSISTTAPLTGGGDLSANRTFAITQSTTSTDGYLSSTDWNTFNNKGSGDVTGPASSTDGVPALFDGTTGKIIKNSTPTGTGNPVMDTNPTFVTRINTPEIKATGSGGVDIHNNSGTQVAIFGAGGSTGTSLIGTTNIGSASADYHQVAGGTGTITDTATGSSTNININIIPKGTGRLQAGGINVPTISSADNFTNKTGNISQWTNDVGYLTSLSGAVTNVSGTANRITSTGGATPQIDIDATYVGQSSITTLGTITTGVWNGTAIGNTYLASGIDATKIADGSVTSTEFQYINSLTSNAQTQIDGKMTNPMTTGGDVIYGGASGVPTRLANGIAGQLLMSSGTTLAPTWATVGVLTDGDKGDITVSSSGAVWTIDNDVVTYAKMQNVSATNRIMGRITAGAGDMEELTAANVATIINTSLDHNVLTNLTVGDVHTQYALLAGRATPQQINLGTASGASTGYFSSTSHATKGKYFLNAAGTITVDELNARFSVGESAPANKFTVATSTAFDGAYVNGGATTIATGFYAVGSSANVSASMQSYGSAYATASLANLAGFSSTGGLVMITDATVASGGTKTWTLRTGGYQAANERIKVDANGYTGINGFDSTYRLYVSEVRSMPDVPDETQYLRAFKAYAYQTDTTALDSDVCSIDGVAKSDGLVTSAIIGVRGEAIPGTTTNSLSYGGVFVADNGTNIGYQCGVSGTGYHQGGIFRATGSGGNGAELYSLSATGKAVYLKNFAAGGYAIYSDGGDNYLGGGTTIFAAGTTALSPVSFPSGTLRTTPAPGDIEYDGVSFYGTLDTTSKRGQIPIEQYFRLTSTGSTISTIANFFGSTSNISLVANAYYEIEIYCYFLNTTAGTVVWTFTNSAAPTAQNIHYRASVATGIAAPGPGVATYLEGNIYNDATAAKALAATGSLTTAVNHFAYFKIWLRNGSGTSLKIQATKSAGSITPGIGSYWKCRRLPDSSTGTFAA